MKNSFRSYGVHDGLLGEIWTVIESFDKKPEPAPIAQVKRKAETETIDEEINAKKVAVKVEEKKFDWVESSKQEIAGRDGKEIALKKLFKKVWMKLKIFPFVNLIIKINFFKVLKNYKKTEDSAQSSSEADLSDLKRKFVKKLRKNSSIFELISNESTDDEKNDDEFNNLTVKYIV